MTLSATLCLLIFAIWRASAQCQNGSCPPNLIRNPNGSGGYALSDNHTSPDIDIQECTYYTGVGPYLCFYKISTGLFDSCHYPYGIAKGDENAEPSLICQGCDGGYGFQSDDSSCVQCQAGSFGPGGTADCSPCASGTTSLDGASACEAIVTDTIVETSTVESTQTQFQTSTETVVKTVLVTPDAQTVTDSVTIQDGVSTVQTQTDATVTSTPQQVYVTSQSTLTAPGSASCLTFVLQFPSACCPNAFLSMKPVNAHAHRRRDFTSLTTITETVTSVETDTVNGDPETTFVTEQSTVGTPVVTITSTQTDPSATTTLVSTHLVTVFAAAPTTTITQVTTVKPTQCAVKNIAVPGLCPRNPSGLPALRQIQKAAIDTYKKLAGNLKIVVDCGSTGQFEF